MNLPTHSSSHGSESPELAPPPPPPPTVAGKEAQNGVVDAGLRSQHHYRRALPKWRYALRESVLPLVRWETPYLAAIQSKMRTPALDTYFAVTANLGTHTFFMVGLPIIIWCGFMDFGKGLIHILAFGVFFTGFVKDFFSLPRPLSPPLQRITMSSHVALEYGFPSTHSTNAVSVAVYALLVLRSEANIFSLTTTLALEALSIFYAISIVFGRLYCGMHGFLDVTVGSLMGAVISVIEFYYVPAMDTWIKSSSYLAPLTVALVVCILVRIHPEPADDCPCFDDSVAFAGVVIGLEFGFWHLSRTKWDAVYNGPDATFDLSALGWKFGIARVFFGVFLIFAWREAMKPALLRLLPHLFRVIETQGLALPRRFFVPASEYKDVPLHMGDDNVLPNVSDIPKLVRSIRGPGRGRAVSIGPQSAADAYETLAYRERRRRESLGSDGGSRVRHQRSLAGLREDAAAQDRNVVEAIEAQDQAGKCSQASGVQSSGRSHGVAEYEQKMGKGTIMVDHPAVAAARSAREDSVEAEPDLSPLEQQDKIGEKEMFSMLVKPRVRYDVEVVTKLVVYAGIAMLAVDLILIAFEFVGLGAVASVGAR